MDSAMQKDVVVEAVRDGGVVAPLLPCSGPTDRGISWRQVYGMEYQYDAGDAEC